MILRKRRQKRLGKRRPKTSMARQVLYGIASILAVVLLGSLIWYVTRLPAVTIDEISIEGGETVPNESVRSAVLQVLSGNYLLLVPHRFVYLYPQERIFEVLDAIPRLHSISVERDGTALSISFSEYIPSALWCLTHAKDSECYFVDSSGYAFAPAPLLEGGALTRHVIEGTETLEEKQAIGPEKFRRIERFLSVLESELGLRISAVTHTEEGDIIYGINGGGSILTASDIGVEETYENLRSILESEEFDHLEPGSFNYIDLRFGNKVFVKEEFDTPTTTESEEPQQVHDAAQ